MAINLVKGQRIDLKKSTGAALNDFCVGVNWGGIVVSSGFLELSKTVQDVDLDLSAALLNTQGALCDHIYSPLYKPEGLAKVGLPPGKLTAASGALRHTGDDRAGDSGGDDGLDNGEEIARYSAECGPLVLRTLHHGFRRGLSLRRRLEIPRYRRRTPIRQFHSAFETTLTNKLKCYHLTTTRRLPV